MTKKQLALEVIDRLKKEHPAACPERAAPGHGEAAGKPSGSH